MLQRQRVYLQCEVASEAFTDSAIPSVSHTDPEASWVGLTEDEIKVRGIKVKKGLFPWTASGRGIANGRDEGVTKLLAWVRHVWTAQIRATLRLMRLGLLAVSAIA